MDSILEDFEILAKGKKIKGSEGSCCARAKLPQTISMKNLYIKILFFNLLMQNL